MTETLVSRRLAAILAADIAGYSRLMGEDEAGTYRALKDHQAVVLPLIEQYGGRVIDTAGDGILAEFPSVIHAVECAVQIQALMNGRNRDVADTRKMFFRIGINVGDVIHDETRIYGDGINVAARLESIAEPGGICVSAKVRVEIDGKVPFALRDLGLRDLKNIAQPVHVFTIESKAPLVSGAAALQRQHRGGRWIKGLAVIVIAGATAAWLLNKARGQPEDFGPPLMSLAVIPFTSASTDASDGRAAEQLTQDITSSLESAMRSSRIISSGRAAQYGGNPVDARRIGQDLNIRYVLEGSLRRNMQEISVTLRLVDGMKGAQVWNSQFPLGEAKGGSPGREVVAPVVSHVRAALEDTERKRVAALPRTARSTALELAMRADDALLRDASPKGRAEARKLYQEALRHDPDSIDALIGQLGLNVASMQDDFLPVDDLKRERDRLSLRAVRADPKDARAWLMRSGALHDQWQWEAALEANSEALRLDPFQLEALRQRAYIMVLMGKPDEALPIIERSLSLDPRSEGRAIHYHDRCMAYMQLKRFLEAIESCEKAIALNDYWFYYLRLTASCAQAGDMTKALRAKDELLKRQPGISVAKIRAFRSSNSEVFLKQREESLFAGMRKAGLPEE